MSIFLHSITEKMLKIYQMAEQFARIILLFTFFRNILCQQFFLMMAMDASINVYCFQTYVVCTGKDKAYVNALSEMNAFEC